MIFFFSFFGADPKQIFHFSAKKWWKCRRKEWTQNFLFCLFSLKFSSCDLSWKSLQVTRLSFDFKWIILQCFRQRRAIFVLFFFFIDWWVEKDSWDGRLCERIERRKEDFKSRYFSLEIFGEKFKVESFRFWIFWEFSSKFFKLFRDEQCKKSVWTYFV